MKSKKTLIITAVIMVITGTVIGYTLSDFSNVNRDKKPVIEISDKTKKTVNTSTQIIYEKEFAKCGHKVVSSLEKADELIGKDIDDIRRLYGTENGYRISWQNQSLVIHQLINEYCPADKEQYRLKEYQGLVAVYRGAKEEEVLERVTEIRMNSLPASIQEDIRNGEFEFKNRATLNDALENFDEYLE